MDQSRNAQPRQPVGDTPASENIAWQGTKVTAAERTQLLRQNPATLWLTGLPGSGKSTIAFEVERRLLATGHAAFVLDGDNVRHGLSRDLGFSPADRTENIRRIAEVARLFNDAGVIAIAAFISPYRRDRAMAREIVGSGRFMETYLCAAIEVCESRDPKGHYKRARAGAIAEFTGVTAPYEIPEAPELAIDTGVLALEECVSAIVRAVAARCIDRDGRTTAVPMDNPDGDASSYTAALNLATT